MLKALIFNSKEDNYYAKLLHSMSDGYILHLILCLEYDPVCFVKPLLHKYVYSYAKKNLLKFIYQFNNRNISKKNIFLAKILYFMACVICTQSEF